MKPIILAPNQPRQFYRGGAAIAAFRNGEGAPRPANGFGPEDWIASTVTMFGATAGLSMLPTGQLLRAAVRADPIDFLGRDHYATFGADPALLVKMLDAGERLPVHVHPDRAFANRHLNCRYGKTEAWVVVGTTGADPVVYVGFRDTVSTATIGTWVAEQESELMLAAMNRMTVSPGDTILVPAGTPHAIGAGVFVIELQEPTDFSVMLEWQQFGMGERAVEQLGLPAPLALSCVDASGWSARRLAAIVHRHALDDRRGTHDLLPPAADPFFRAEQIVVETSVELSAQFAILVVLSGAARIECDDGVVDVRGGNALLVPHSAGNLRITGTASLVRCLPPRLG